MTDLKFSSGFDSLDNVLQGIQKGDNVVLQTDNTDDYIFFARRFAECILSDNKTLVYFRFAEHKEVLSNGEAEIVRLDPALGFEHFINGIFGIIEKKGIGAAYVFDCLSDLSAEWYSDRMLANFFRLTCPYLYRLDTVAYFMLLKGSNSRIATDMIQRTAQVVIDVFRIGDRRYILPVKAEGRFTPTLYMLHSCEGELFKPVTSSVEVSKIFSRIPHKWGNVSQQREDVWMQIFSRAMELQEQEVWDKAKDENYRKVRKQLIRMMMTREEKLAELCEKHFEISNLVSIGRRMIGTGLIGGKSVGMLLAGKILRNKDKIWDEILEQHDSFFLGSDVFYTYLVENDCWWARRELIKSGRIGDAEAIRQKLLKGSFSERIIEQFREMLDYFGQSPIIVRSSSLLEDAYGNAFSGKYDSFFLANQGTPQERLEAFLDAVRKVFASTMSQDALYYRLERGLFYKDEQMALLIQRVSGQFVGKYYFPHCAGVAYSFNPFVWNTRIKPEDGVMRIVFGLGTRAVDQHGGDYTKIVALGEPALRPEKNFDELIRYSQKSMDLIDIDENKLKSEDFSSILAIVPPEVMGLLSDEDLKAAELARSMGISSSAPRVLSFENLLLRTDFVSRMKAMLQTLQAEYACAVDLEFTANFAEGGRYFINLLQCRPFQAPLEMRSIKEDVDKISEDKLLIRSGGPIIGQSAVRRIRRIIYVKPESYSTFSQSEKYSVARLVGAISNSDPSIKGEIALIGPGRWGSKMPELGIPVSFAEIKNCGVLCELAMMHEGLTPDISLGTHFFNDLVEFRIVYAALLPSDKMSFFKPERIIYKENRILQIAPDFANFADAVHVLDAEKDKSSGYFMLYVDALKQKFAIFRV